MREALSSVVTPVTEDTTVFLKSKPYPHPRCGLFRTLYTLVVRERERMTLQIGRNIILLLLICRFQSDTRFNIGYTFVPLILRYRRRLLLLLLLLVLSCVVRELLTLTLQRTI